MKYEIISALAQWHIRKIGKGNRVTGTLNYPCFNICPPQSCGTGMKPKAVGVLPLCELRCYKVFSVLFHPNSLKKAVTENPREDD